jgi:hypothetical protein
MCFSVKYLRKILFINGLIARQYLFSPKIYYPCPILRPLKSGFCFTRQFMLNPGCPPKKIKK